MQRLILCLLGVIVIGVTQSQAQNASEDLAEAYRAYQESLSAGDIQQALAHSKTAYEVGRKDLGDSHETAAVLTYNYSRMLDMSRIPREAAKIATEAREIAERVHGKDSPEMLMFLSHEGETLVKIYGYDDAVEVADQMIDIARDHYGESSVEAGDSYLFAASAHLENGWGIRSRNYLRDALEIYQEQLDDKDPKIAKTHFDLGRYQMAWNRQESAVEHFTTAIDIWSESPDQFRAIIGSARTFLVTAYTEMDETDKATAQAQIIGREMLGRGGEYGQADAEPLYRKVPRYPTNVTRPEERVRVLFNFTIDEEGFVKDIVLESNDGHPAFARAAEEALQEWRYAPAVIDGKFVPRRNNRVYVNFESDDD